MKVIAVFATLLLATCSASGQANGGATQQAPTTACNEIKQANSTAPAAPLRLVKGTKLIVTETEDETNEGEHNHAVLTSEYTITKISKTEIRFDTHNILKSSSDGYFGDRSDEPGQYLPLGDPRLAGEWGEPTDIYVETPIFIGTVRVLYRHDRAAGEIWRWVSIDPVEFDVKLEDGSRVRVRADYSKELILFNGIKSWYEDFYLTDFGFVPVWARDTLERPGRTEESIDVLTGVEQPKSHRQQATGNRPQKKQGIGNRDQGKETATAFSREFARMKELNLLSKCSASN